MHPHIARLAAILLFAITAYTALSGPIPDNKPDHYPDWWFERDVIPRLPAYSATVPPTLKWPDHYPVSDDFAAVNLGQLKFMALKAAEEMNDKLAPFGGAGEAFDTIQADWSAGSDNYTAINIGQLKHVSNTLYSQLKKSGYTDRNPWGITWGQADDFALANLGQLKRVFAFELRGAPESLWPTLDADLDSLSDAWEISYFGTTSINPAADADGDGVSNLLEFQGGSDPADRFSIPNGSSSGHIKCLNGDTFVSAGGAFLPAPLVFRLSKSSDGSAPMVDAPVTVTVLGGYAGLCKSTTPPLQLVSEITLRTDSNGDAKLDTAGLPVGLYFKQPTEAGTQVIIAKAGPWQTTIVATVAPPGSTSALLGNATLWLSADNGPVTAPSSSKVTSWLDRSGRGFSATQALTNTQPTLVENSHYNRLGVRFDGVDDHLVVSGLTSAMPEYTLTWLFTPSTLTNGGQTLASGNAGGFRFSVSSDGSASVGTNQATLLGAGPIPPGTLAANTWALLTFTFKDGVGSFYKNGGLVATKAGMATPATWGTLRLGASTSQTLRGDLAELMLHDRALVHSEVLVLKDHIFAKYDFHTDADMNGRLDLEDSGAASAPTVSISAPLDDATL